MAGEGTNGAAMAHPQVQFGGVIWQKKTLWHVLRHCIRHSKILRGSLRASSQNKIQGKNICGPNLVDFDP